jgi:hypothetical protein
MQGRMGMQTRVQTSIAIANHKQSYVGQIELDKAVFRC